MPVLSTGKTWRSAVGWCLRARPHDVAAYLDENTFGLGDTVADINTLSHEVAEWMNDPLVDNVAPQWASPPPVFSACDSSLLEVADPADFFFSTVTLNGLAYHPQDLVFLSWFARASPSAAVNGYYDFDNRIRTFSQPCPDSTTYSFTTFDVPASTRTILGGINNLGQIVGLYRDQGGLSHGFLLDDGVVTPIDFPGAALTQAEKIGDRGEVVGFFQDAAGHSHGFSFENGGFDGADGIVRGFLLRGEALTTLDAPFAFEDEVEAINDSGRIVGDYDSGTVTDSFGLAFDRGRFTRLDFSGAGFTTPYSINNGGTVVGAYVYDPSFVQFFSGFTKTGDVFDRVNYFDENFVYDTLLRGTNDRGVLVGYFANHGLHGLIARPSPSPSSTASR